MKKILNYTLWGILGFFILVSLPIGVSLCVEQATTIATTLHMSQLKEGDIIFHYSTSQQSKLIAVGTQSYITHCGIIVFRNGEPMVYEAIKTVRLTPLKKFINRARDAKVWIKRTNLDIKKIQTNYIGMPYDLQFKFNNNKMYCSELVYLTYKEQFGVELCEPQKVEDYLILGTNHIKKIQETMNNRNIKLKQLAVAPVDIFNSKYLHRVSF